MDTAIMPRVPTGNMTAPCVVVGALAAAAILGDGTGKRPFTVSRHEEAAQG